VRKLVFLFAIFVAAHPRLTAQQVTIRIPFGLDNTDIVTFEQSRVSISDVKHWMKFAEIGYYNSYGISLSGCDESAAVRLAKDVDQGHRVIDELGHETEYPSELEPIVRYLKREVRFKVWLGEQYLQYAKMGGAPESAYQNGDMESCRSITESIRDEPNKRKACQRLGNQWTQCALRDAAHQLGDYPKKEWKMFLDAYCIKEQLVLSPDNGD
jgi:hypothetical protein